MFESVIESIFAPEVTIVSSTFKLLLAMLLGAVIGVERKRKGQIAGVRTFSLICMGATLCMIISIYVPQVYLGLKNGDPSRIAAQVVSGIGFLGAGAIIQMKGSVRGLTTAAGIWMAAALGLAVGVGMYVVAVVATLLILFILIQPERIEHKVSLGADARTIRLEVSEIIEDIQPYKEALERHRVHLSKFYVSYDYNAPSTRLNLVILAREHVDYIALFNDMRTLAPTSGITLANQVSL